jgi:hypothetical protein
MASWLYFLRKVAALSTEGRERLEIGGASGHSHSGAGLSSDWGQAAIAKSATGLPSKRCPKLEPNLPLSLLGAAPFRPGLACRQPHHSGRPRLLFIRGPCAKGRYPARSLSVCAPLARNGRGAALIQANAGIAAPQRRVRVAYLALDPGPLPSQNSKPTPATRADPGSGCLMSLCR